MPPAFAASRARPRARRRRPSPTSSASWSRPCPTPCSDGEDYRLQSLPGGDHSAATDCQATLHCVDAKKGAVHWKKDGVGKYHASLMRTGNGKLLMVEEAGSLVLLEPSGEKYQELCRSKISGNTWAHPAVAEGRLYIRDQKELVCVQLP